MRDVLVYSILCHFALLIYLLPAFLAALDIAVVAIALPTIVDDIGGESGYSWVGSAYLLSASVLPF